MKSGDAGSSLVIAVLMLVLLVLMGAAAVTTSCIEVDVAANEQTYRQNLYRAEAAALVGAQKLEKETDEAALRDLAFPHIRYAGLAHPDVFHRANWDPEHVLTAMDPQCVFMGVRPAAPAAGASLDMERSRLHHFDIYGRSDQKGGTVIVQIGWRKRY